MEPILEAIGRSAGVPVLVLMGVIVMQYQQLRDERNARSRDNDRTAEALEKMADAMAALTIRIMECRK